MNRTIARTVVAAAVIAGVFVAGSVAGAATGWRRPFATGSDTGQYGGYASVRGDVVQPRGLTIRVRTKGDSTPNISLFFNCSADIRARAPT
jgi:hypothetical protein